MGTRHGSAGLPQLKKPIGVLAITGALTALALPTARAAAGDLDPSFDGDGVATWSATPKNEFANAVTHHSDGKIVTAGYALNALPGDFNANLVVSRHNADGSLDTSFGQGAGSTVTDLGVYNERLNDVALQADGKIVAAGQANINVGGPNTSVVVRYSIDGALDPTFGGGDGIVLLDVVPPTTSNSEVSESIAVDDQGRIIVAGWSQIGPGDQDFVVMRLDPNGDLDSGFGGDGIVTTSVLGLDKASGIALRADGRIVVSGTANGNFALVRYDIDGDLDATFSGDGKLTTDFGGTQDTAFDVEIDANDRIVVAGFGGANKYLSVARYTSTGAPDGTFSGDGKTTTSKLARATSVAAAIGLAIQVDGKLVVGGGVNGLAGVDYGAARFNVEGSLDTTFSGDGVVKFDLSADQDYGTDVGVDAAGNIVVAGGVDGAIQNPDGSHDGASMLVRFQGDLAASACPGLTITNTITGTPGNDIVVGTPGNDFIIGGGGNDTITGADGDDCIYGGTGDDVIDAGAGNDRLFSEAGNDTLTGGSGLDKIVAQVGDDIIRIAAGDVPAASTEILKGKAGSDTAELGAGLSTDNVTGGPPTFTVTDPLTDGTYSAVKVEAILDT